jgi:hypothetical protein
LLRKPPREIVGKRRRRRVEVPSEMRDWISATPNGSEPAIQEALPEGKGFLDFEVDWGCGRGTCSARKTLPIR